MIKEKYGDSYGDKFRQYEDRIKELEKENAELRKKLKPENCLKLLAKEGYIKFTSEHLTKAKELLKRCYENYIYLEPLRSEIKQFLSEVEK